MSKVQVRDETTGAKSTAKPTFQNATHADSHRSGQGDEIDGDQIDIDLGVMGYTPDTTSGIAPNSTHLAAHLKGIENKVLLAFPGLFASFSAAAGGTALLANTLQRVGGIAGAADFPLPALAGVTNGQFYGLHDENGNATTYAITITPDGAETINGVNAAITLGDDYGVRGLFKTSATNWAIIWTTAGAGSSTHAPTHIQGGGDEIDGDQIDIDFTPANYTPDVAPAEVTDADHLSAHLKGIDTALAAGGVLAGDASLLYESIQFLFDPSDRNTHPGSGTTVTDLISGNTATMTSVSLTDNRMEWGVAGGIISFAKPAALDDNFATGGTAALWFRMDSLGVAGTAGHMVSTENTGATIGYTITANVGDTLGLAQKFSGTDGAWVFDFTPDSVWHHLVVVYDASNVANVPVFYLDGVVTTTDQVLSTPTGAFSSDAGQTLDLGNRIDLPTGTTHDGALDIVQLHDVEWTQAEVSRHYRSTRDRFFDPVAIEGLIDISASDTTADATPITLVTLSTSADDSVILLDLSFLAKDTTAEETLEQGVRASFYRDGSSVLTQRSVNFYSNERDDVTWTGSLLISGQDILVQFQGDATNSTSVTLKGIAQEL
jgi:hypothetical protein